MSRVSDTDLAAFMNLANPQKTRLADLQEDIAGGHQRTGDFSGDAGTGVCRQNSEASTASDVARSITQTNEAPPASATLHERQNHLTSLVSSEVEGRQPPLAGYNNISSSRVLSEASRAPSERGAQSCVARSEVREADTLTRVESREGTEIGEPSACASMSGARSVDDRFGKYMSHRTRQPRTSGPFNVDAAALREKQNVLMDIERLKGQGVTFSQEWTLDHSLDDMQYEVRRHMLHVEEKNNTKMLRDGMRMICTGVEMLNGRFKVLELNGWAADVCSDMSKYDPALGKLYRKYWRRSQSSTPEMELATALLMSMGMHHFKRKLASGIFPLHPGAREPQFSPPGRPKRMSSPAPSQTSSEGAPP